MKFDYVLLGLVTLTSIHLSSGQCNNGLAGVDNGDVCCHAECGTCGGSGCARRPGGGSNCCSGMIRDSGIMCSIAQVAPCIIDDSLEETFCSNGLLGVDEGGICCSASCGSCGGSDCGRRPGGGDNCCRGAIMDSEVYCSVSQAAPCIMDEEDPTCSNGLPGVQTDTVCCDAQCGTCGGAGCSMRPGGEEACCTTEILTGGENCTTTMAAPCIVDGGFPPVPVEFCSNGVIGVESNGFCCEGGCGTCGGSGCARRPGGPEACCTSRIEESEVSCSASLAAPCIV